jgi:hypothetical protein
MVSHCSPFMTLKQVCCSWLFTLLTFAYHHLHFRLSSPPLSLSPLFLLIPANGRSTDTEIMYTHTHDGDKFTCSVVKAPVNGYAPFDIPPTAVATGMIIHSAVRWVRMEDFHSLSHSLCLALTVHVLTSSITLGLLNVGDQQAIVYTNVTVSFSIMTVILWVAAGGCCGVFVVLLLLAWLVVIIIIIVIDM